jgi:hypothetical protein
MDPHGVPSGGDWALQRTGALFFEGTEQLSVSDCLFIRLDGNALFLSGYNRYFMRIPNLHINNVFRGKVEQKIFLLYATVADFIIYYCMIEMLP